MNNSMRDPMRLQITSGWYCLGLRWASPLDQETCRSTGWEAVSTVEPSSHLAVGRGELGQVGDEPTTHARV